MPDRPQAPAADLLQRCQALVADAGQSAADALKADAANRERYLRCQVLANGLVGYINGLIRAGLIQPAK